jgi:tetratricopeptide (TPR) repeat protein
MIRSNLAYARELRGKTGGNADVLQQARADLERVVAEQPQNPSFRADLGLVCCNQGRFLAVLGRTAEALKALERSQAVLGQLVLENPTVNVFRNRLIFSGLLDAKWLNAAGRPDDALGVLRRTRELVDADLDKAPDRIDRRLELGQILIRTGDALARNGHTGPALEALNRAIAIIEVALGEDNEVLIQYDLACAYTIKVGLLGRDPVALSHPQEMSRAADLAIDRLHRLVALGYRPRHWFEHDPQLDAIRGRADFQLLMMDLAMPADPFLR